MRWISPPPGQGSRLAPIVALVLVFLVFGPIQSWAQTGKIKDWNNQQDIMKSAIGLHYGKLAGQGVSFRFPLKWWLYAQVGGGIWHTADDKKHNLGFQLNYLLRQDDRLRLYLGAGSGYFYHRELVDNSGGNEYWSTKDHWNVGAGVGLEYLVGVRWALQAELDFVRTGDNKEIKVAPQVGVHYYW
jgi:hypothetical protein